MDDLPKDLAKPETKGWELRDVMGIVVGGMLIVLSLVMMIYGVLA